TGGIALYRKDRQDAVAHELQHVAARLGDRLDQGTGIGVEEGDQLRRRQGLAEAGEVLQVAAPEHRLELAGYATQDAAFENPARSVAAEVGFRDRARDVLQALAFERQRQDRREPAD